MKITINIFHIPKESHIIPQKKKKKKTKGKKGRKKKRHGEEGIESGPEEPCFLAWASSILFYLVAQHASKALLPLKMIREYRLILTLAQTKHN